MTDRYLRWDYKRSCEKKGNYTRIILETLNQQLFKEASSRVQYLLLFALGFERGHTVMNVTLESREDFLEATVIGQLSLSEAIEVFKKIVDAAAERGLVNILVDSLAVEGELSTLERYELGKTMAEYCGRQSTNLKWAAIGKAPAVDGFAAQVAWNRGLVTQVFSERQAALGWLKVFGSKPPPRLKN